MSAEKQERRTEYLTQQVKSDTSPDGSRSAFIIETKESALGKSVDPVTHSVYCFFT